MLVPVVRKSLRVTVVLFAVVSIAQSLSDKPVSALIAGLGLGGLAFALSKAPLPSKQTGEKLPECVIDLRLQVTCCKESLH